VDANTLDRELNDGSTMGGLLADAEAKLLEALVQEEELDRREDEERAARRGTGSDLAGPAAPRAPAPPSWLPKSLTLPWDSSDR